MIYNFLGVQLVIVETVSQELLAWEGIITKHKYHKFIPPSIIWVIRNERNKKVFEVDILILILLRIDGYIFLVLLFLATI